MPSPYATHPAFYHDNARAARQYAAKIARNTKWVDVTIVCRDPDCGKEFIWRTTEAFISHPRKTGRREYCDRCNSPAAKRRRMLARKEAQ